MRILFTKPIMAFCITVMVLSACSSGGIFSKFEKNRAVSEEVVSETEKPKLRSAVRKNPQNLGRITVANAAKVSNTELKVAVAKSSVRAEQDLGKTVISLGLLDQTGFWLQTPLVSAEAEGRVLYAGTGKTANVRLIPNGAPSGSGSQMSIAAMQLLGIAISDLVEVQVFTR
ncbi:hypothetical protein F9L33_06010 [Amylibacter sp. SFDW26]|uniref:hypothetical protein n=1 Tax=Amylibacter sp. SFDW26 TaxID=2652722 RepID=UPI0012628CB8|nr:hypothetical protein [Amylibacter sp. SFDW26]KAB7616304.1 hypothetical protein F9L33_06010 [Amylibacter sp. SFDW26]